MEEKRTSLEIIAPSAEEAIARGLSELGLSESAVEVEVLDSGSKGLFGLGYRQARIRLTIKEQTASKQIEPEVLPPVIVEPHEAVPSEIPTAQITEKSSVKRMVDAENVQTQAQPVEPALELAEMPDDQLLVIGREVVQELLDKMKVKARLNVRFGEPEDPKDKIPLLVDVRGDDLSILIGPKAETLNALQYIAGLIIGKEVGHSVPLVVDVEGYRARRSQQIRSLARRMAEQAVRTGRRQVLEPMPANERRLVHIELRDNPQVTTESIGEDPHRKVTINPK